MLNFIISLLFGAFIDSLYLTLFICYFKNIKSKRLLLFLLIFIGYILFIMIKRYELIFYSFYIIYIYFVIKILYRTQIIDIFIIIFSYIYMILSCIVGSMFININYKLGLVINKITLLSIFIFKNKFNEYYIKYSKYWNRRSDYKVKIKSLTLRNTSLLFMNFMIILLYLCLIYTFVYYNSL